MKTDLFDVVAVLEVISPDDKRYLVVDILACFCGGAHAAEERSADAVADQDNEATSFEEVPVTSFKKKTEGCLAGSSGTCGHCTGLLLAIRFAGEVADQAQDPTKPKTVCTEILCPWLAPSDGTVANFLVAAWKIMFRKMEMDTRGNVVPKRATVANTGSDKRANFNPFVAEDFAAIEFLSPKSIAALTKFFAAVQDAIGEKCAAELQWYRTLRIVTTNSASATGNSSTGAAGNSMGAAGNSSTGAAGNSTGATGAAGNSASASGNSTGAAGNNTGAAGNSTGAQPMSIDETGALTLLDLQFEFHC
jgi:hypothetical protein